MANPAHLEILEQGVEAWNKWRKRNPDIKPNLDEANLEYKILDEANFKNSSLNSAILQYASLRGTDLQEADLRGSYTHNIFNVGRDMQAAAGREWGANLTGANLFGANLKGAHLSGAYFNNANLTEVDLAHTSLNGVIFGNTTFSNINFSNVRDLELARHLSPSQISISTIQRGQGNIPEVFLRGCGLSDFEIEYSKLYNPNLSNQEIDEILYQIHDLRAQQPLQISPLFISYSHADDKFVDNVEEQLDRRGIRFWRDVHHATAGPLEKQIDRAIQLNPTVLVILSENSIKSDWVEHEVRTARELAKKLSRHVLCPVALDDSWKSSPWPKRVMEQVMEYNILDFSKWENDVEFEKQFKKLIDGLDLFYQ